jgi:Flp pilus assembly protein TadB
VTGFLGVQPSFMLDFVVVALAAVLLGMALGVWQARKHRFKIHSRMMMILALILLGVVLLFELDLRLHGGLEGLASAAGREARAESTGIRLLLNGHLVLAFTTLILWGVTLTKAVRHFGWKNPVSGIYQKSHRILAWSSLWGMFAVAVSGWLLYYFIFLA